MAGLKPREKLMLMKKRKRKADEADALDQGPSTKVKPDVEDSEVSPKPCTQASAGISSSGVGA